MMILIILTSTMKRITTMTMTDDEDDDDKSVHSEQMMQTNLIACLPNEGKKRQAMHSLNTTT